MRGWSPLGWRSAVFWQCHLCVVARTVPYLPGEAENGSDCHSQRLYPLLRGRTERFGCGWTVRSLWGGIVSIWKCLWGESLQCRMVRVGVSQCLNGGWRNHQGTNTFCLRRYAWRLYIISLGTFCLPIPLVCWYIMSADTFYTPRRSIPICFVPKPSVYRYVLLLIHFITGMLWADAIIF